MRGERSDGGGVGMLERKARGGGVRGCGGLRGGVEGKGETGSRRRHGRATSTADGAGVG